METVDVGADRGSVGQASSPRRRAAGAAAGHRVVVIDGARLAYDDEGEGEAVVCLHAIGHGAGDFAGLRARFRGRARVLALDWPSHGASDADGHPASAIRYEHVLARFLDAAGLSRVVLLGNSIGGAAAIRYAAAHPARVRGLVLANPGGLAPHGLLTRGFTAAMAALFRAGVRRRGWYPGAFAAFCARVLRGDAAAVQRERIAASAYEVAPLLTEAWTSFGAPEADLRELAATVRCPVLAAWATLDPVNPLWINRGGIARFRDVTRATFRAGHAPFLETPAAWDPVFARFLDALPA